MVSIMEIMQLCRLCLVKEQVNIPIFEEQDDVRQICLKITSCLPVKITKEDKLPKKICDGCLYKLELLYQFYNTTANAEKQLLTWIEQINMDANEKNLENLAAQSTPPTVKQEKLEPVESTNENPDMSAEAQNYMLDQETFQPDFTFKESQGSTADAVDAAENSDEPLAKRPRRGRPRQATKPIPPESLDSSDNDNDNDDAGDSMLEMTVTKTEEESESEGEENVDDPEPTKFEAVGEDTEQPGPSGLGKGGADGPDTNGTKRSGKRRDLAWPCKKCSMTFKSKNSLYDHSRTAHLQLPREHLANYVFDECSKIFSCKICDFHTENKKEIENHVLTHEEAFTCEVCGATVHSACMYSLHLYQHDQQAGYRCPLCDFKRNKKSLVMVHINRVHLGRYTYKCKHCGKGFDYVQTYKEHENSHVTAQAVSCVVCKKEYAYTKYLVYHQLNSHRVLTCDPKQENQCKICGKSFDRKRLLEVHVRIHQDNEVMSSHLCEQCGRNFKTIASLKSHREIHSGIKPYKCSYCEKTFRRKNYLIHHERVHTGERPYVCSVCGRAFAQYAPLKTHERTHTGEKPYACERCGNRYTKKMSLQNHMMISSCGW